MTSNDRFVWPAIICVGYGARLVVSVLNPKLNKKNGDSTLPFSHK